MFHELFLLNIRV